MTHLHVISSMIYDVTTKKYCSYLLDAPGEGWWHRQVLAGLRADRQRAPQRLVIRLVIVGLRSMRIGFIALAQFVLDGLQLREPRFLANGPLTKRLRPSIPCPRAYIRYGVTKLVHGSRRAQQYFDHLYCLACQM